MVEGEEGRHRVATSLDSAVLEHGDILMGCIVDLCTLSLDACVQMRGGALERNVKA